jgi:hypothetical protein
VDAVVHAARELLAGKGGGHERPPTEATHA